MIEPSKESVDRGIAEFQKIMDEEFGLHWENILFCERDSQEDIDNFKSDAVVFIYQAMVAKS